MAISKTHKRELVGDYTDWIKKSQALVIAEYKGLTMSDLDTLRSRMRENGGEFHVIKNTLGKLAFEEAGLKVPDDYFEGSTAIGFAFTDAAGTAKMLMEYSRTSEFLKIKGGFLGQQVMNSEDVRSLAELPPLPVMRARLLGALLAPAGQLARTIAEPARSLAAVFKAYSDREAASTPA